MKRIKTEYRASLVSISLLVILFTLVGPMEIYVGNISEFNFAPTEFIGIFIVIALLLLLVGALVLSILPEKLSRILQVLIFSISIACYIQNLFLNQNLISDDGGTMNWEGLRGTTRVNLVVWLLILLIGCLLPVWVKNYRKIYLGITLFLSAIQVVTFGSLLINGISYERENTHYVISGKEQYALAPGKNIVVFVLDHYSNSQFDLLLDQQPELRQTLQDFTYYNNADSHYNFTFPSIPHMLTGEEVDLSMTKEEWKESIWQTERCINFYEQMHAAGYTCNFYSENEAYISLGNMGYLRNSFDNVVQCEPRINRGLIVRLLEKMTIYKMAPYIVKPYFEVAYYVFGETTVYDLADGSVVYGNGEFYQKLQETGLSLSTDMENSYIFMHLYGHHTPYQNDELGRVVSFQETDAMRCQMGMWVMLEAYLNQMKQLGVYDRAAIIITSDHGNSMEEHEPQPIFFVKEPYANGNEMAVSTAPISHDDYLATLLQLAGLDSAEYGKSIFEWHEGEERYREVCYPENGFYVYSYMRNRQELIEKMEADVYEFRESETDWRR